MIPSESVLNRAASRVASSRDLEDLERFVALTIQKEGATGIDRLIGHQVAEVRAVLAKSAKLLSRHIDKLIEDRDATVIASLKSNPNLQRRHIDLLERIIFVDGIERVEDLLAPMVRIPAEWEPHACCWMAWALHPDDWEDLIQAKAELEKVIQTIAEFEPVHLLAAPEQLADARNRFPGDNVKVIEAPVDDIWMRDIAPTFALRGSEVLAIDYNFNGWGNTTARRSRPGDRLAATASAIFDVPRICAPFISEGGAFITNGDRTLITTESCLLKRNRNPFGPRRIRKQRIAEQAFKEFGVHRLIWLRGDPGEPITSGHIDG